MLNRMALEEISWEECIRTMVNGEFWGIFQGWGTKCHQGRRLRG
jgi:hypothetical protein